LWVPSILFTVRETEFYFTNFLGRLSLSESLKYHQSHAWSTQFFLQRKFFPASHKASKLKQVSGTLIIKGQFASPTIKGKFGGRVEITVVNKGQETSTMR